MLHDKHCSSLCLLLAIFVDLTGWPTQRWEGNRDCPLSLHQDLHNCSHLFVCFSFLVWFCPQLWYICLTVMFYWWTVPLICCRHIYTTVCLWRWEDNMQNQMVPSIMWFPGTKLKQLGGKCLYLLQDATHWPHSGELQEWAEQWRGRSAVCWVVG